MDSLKLEDALRKLIKENYGSIPNFAEKIGMPSSSVYNALNRGLKNTRTELTDKIYRELNIDWDTARLDNFHGLKLKATGKGFIDVPLFGTIDAGMSIEIAAIEDAFPIPVRVHEKYPDAFLLKVVGESMNKILPNGCYALVDPCKDVEARTALCGVRQRLRCHCEAC